MTHEQRMRAAVEAGAKASQGRWLPDGPDPGDKRYFICGSNLWVDHDDVDQKEAVADGDFAAKAANARESMALALRIAEAARESMFSRNWAGAASRLAKLLKEFYGDDDAK